MAAERIDRLKQLRETEYKGGLLQQWGKLALEKALNDRLLKAHPQSRELVDQLVKHYLSRYYLTKVAKTLIDEGLVTVTRVQGIKYDKILHHKDEDGICQIFDNLAVLISLPHDSPKKIDSKVWKESFPNFNKTDLQAAIVSPFLVIRWKGFRAGMHRYALQVAGLIDTNCLSEGTDFWEVYQQYMPLIEPDAHVEDTNISLCEKLTENEKEAENFEKEMELTMEGVPRYSGCTTVVTVKSNPRER